MYCDFDIIFYKNIYGLVNYKNAFVIMHWETNGLKNGYLGSKDMFYKRYNTFDIECYKIYNYGLLSNGINTDDLLLKHYWHHGYNENRIINDVLIGENFASVLKHYNIRFANTDMNNTKYKLLIKEYNLRVSNENSNNNSNIILIDPEPEQYFRYAINNIVYILFTPYVKNENIMGYIKLKNPSNVLLAFCSTFEQHKLLNDNNKRNIKIDLNFYLNKIEKPNEKYIYLCNYQDSIKYEKIVKYYDKRIIIGNTDMDIKNLIVINLTKKINSEFIDKIIQYCPYICVYVDHIDNKDIKKNIMKIKNIDDIINYITIIDQFIDNKILKIDQNNLPIIKKNLNCFIYDISSYKTIVILCNIDKITAYKETLYLSQFLSNENKIVKLFTYSEKLNGYIDDLQNFLINEAKINNIDLIITKDPLNDNVFNIITSITSNTNSDIIYLVASNDRCKIDVDNINNMVKKCKTYCNDINFIKYFANKGICVKLFYDNLVKCHNYQLSNSSTDICNTFKKYKYGIVFDEYINIHNIHNYYDIFSDNCNYKNLIIGKNMENINTNTNELMKDVEIFCINHRNGLYNIDVVDALLYGCKIIDVKFIKKLSQLQSELPLQVPLPLPEPLPIKEKPNIMLDILNSKKICILSSCEPSNNIIEFMEEMKFLGIMITYTILTTYTTYLDNITSSIKHIDIYDEVDIKKYVDDSINENYDMIINYNYNYNCNDYIIKLKKSSRIYYEYTNTDTDIDTILDINNYISDELICFINFNPQNISYGGGNSFTMNLCKYIDKSKKIKYIFDIDIDNINTINTINTKIDIYLLVDIRKDGKFKKYSLDEIYNHKLKYNKDNGIIIFRVNDCDITRINGTREKDLLKYNDIIDYYVFNSNFIKDYYFDKYDIISKKPCSVIYNTTDSTYFNLSELKLYDKLKYNEKIKIVTHHWSDNINKGYDIYQKLYNYTKTNDIDIEFVFIGRKYCDKFSSNCKSNEDIPNIPNIPKIHGPYHGYQLAQNLKMCHIYITASIYDACPMHVLEGLSCGLPILYIDHDGGARDICTMGNKVGESFTDINSLIVGINKIKLNYNEYVENIKKNIDLYNSNKCYEKFCNLFIKQKINKK